VGLGLFRDDGTLLTANRPFAHMLGYESPAELQALSAVCGVFASPEDQSRAFASFTGPEAARHALFRRKDGCRRSHPVLAGQRSANHEVTLAVFETRDTPNPLFPSPSA
jgi:PAS domain-containing protein